jgi:hypothetical protein
MPLFPAGVFFVRRRFSLTVDQTDPIATAVPQFHAAWPALKSGSERSAWQFARIDVHWLRRFVPGAEQQGFMSENINKHSKHPHLG